MTVAEFITDKFSQFGVDLSSTELAALLADNGIDELTEYEKTIAQKAIVSIVPELLLRPAISEGGYSIKYDSNDITAYYSMLCKELGVEDKLKQEPKITNRSNLW